GRHPPQPPPALVQVLTASTLPHWPERTTAVMSPLETLLHEHTCASSPSSSSTPPPRPPRMSVSGCSGSTPPDFTIASRLMYSSASPASIPPTKRLPSLSRTIFL